MDKPEKQSKENRHIAVAMSGGVDSSVAAALMVEKYGKENVFGITMRLFCYGGKETGPKNCCSLAAINDAKAVCKKLGIKHYVLDFEKEFEKEIIQDFISEYLKGRTPNPCVRCNSIIKFEYLFAKVRNLGGEFLATGHYARIQPPAASRQPLGFKLIKGKDKKKDQGYFLYALTQEQLAHVLFPLGDYKKEEVRKFAKKFGLKTAEKVESQEICFVSGTNYHEYLETRMDANFNKHHELTRIKKGNIVDKEGDVLGTHKGLPFYTIGQRRGLNVSYIHKRNTNNSLRDTNRPPLYVIGIDAKKNQLIVGEEKDLYKKEFEVSDFHWISGEMPKKEFEADVMIRYNMIPVKAKIFPKNKNAKVIFDKPQKSITPGQSAVFYHKDNVLGGGIISF